MSTRKKLTAGASREELLSIEYRTTPRHRILQRCFASLPESQQGEELRCIAFNISATGIALALPFAPKQGTILVLKPWELPAAPPLLVRVMYAIPVTSLWHCGCESIAPLSEKDLQAWLMGPRDWVPEVQPEGRS